MGDFVETTGGVRHAFVLSPAGQMLASSGALDREQAEQFATMVFTLGVLAQSLDTVCGAGRARRTLMNLSSGVLCHMALPSGFFLAVVAQSGGNSQQVGHEATCLADRVGPILAPEIRAEPHNRLLG
ncbi:roadblock/LC7 domain-containing protein [Streptomyces sp. BA2]|uniref:roadblock/LC7 domain-containing protein n=1 Tax=Streptomyces sp. BA2 TaxID=436595 RepID=UPI001368BB73